MQYRNRYILLFILILWPATNALAGSARDDVASLVRSLGYGAGIHQFKNYVLRGRDDSFAIAKRSLSSALDSVRRLKNSKEFTREDLLALDTLERTVVAYDTALSEIVELRDKGWRLANIDLSVKIDDEEAIEALDRVRAKWTWSDFEEIEFQLGYGKGIHNFKNYVLRQQERYHTLALENFLSVESLIVTSLGDAKLPEPDREALQDIGRVVQSYRNYLSLVGRLHAMQRTERQVDLAVKVNDGPAIAGLRTLQK